MTKDKREALIEKARLAFNKAWHKEDERIERWDRDDRGKGNRSRAGIVAALAVFEQAHTPTDDERDRCNVSWAASPEWGDRKHECDLDRGHSGDHACGWCIACEFSASTHPEPIQAAIERVLDEAGYSVLDEWRADVVHLIAEWAAGFRRTVQDEPADNGHDGWCGCEKCAPEPQGEPNTWSVERAAVALYRLDHPAYLLHTFEAVPLLDTVLAYRKRAWAALRAAAVTEQGGENRG